MEFNIDEAIDTMNSKEDIRIVPIHEEDFPILADLIRQQQQFHYELDTENNERFLEIGVEEFREYMTKESDYRCFVAINCSSGKPCGFIASTISVSEDRSAFEAYIEDIFVEEKFRKIEVGSALMNALFTSLAVRSIQDVEVHITKGNEGVFDFYKKFGFAFERRDDTGYIFKKKTIVYKDTKDFNKLELADLFTSVGWVTYSANYPERLVDAMKNSNTVFSAYDGANLVGLISAIDDGMHVFIVYLLVKPEYQHKGVGKTLLSKVLDCYKNHKVILTTDEETVGYYNKFGFELDSVGLVRIDL